MRDLRSQDVWRTIVVRVRAGTSSSSWRRGKGMGLGIVRQQTRKGIKSGLYKRIKE